MILHWLLNQLLNIVGKMLQLWLQRAFDPDTDISKISTNPWSLIQWSLTWWSSDLWYGFSRKLSFEQDYNPPLHHDPVDKCLFTNFPWSHEMWMASWHCSHTNMLYLSLFQRSFHSQSWPLTSYNSCTWKDTSCLDCLCVNSSLHANSNILIFLVFYRINKTL